MIPRKVDLTQNQLFLDDRWIEDTQRLSRLWHRAEVYPEPVVRPDKPWEGANLLMSGTVFKVGETWRMYYLTRGTATAPPAFCVAESDDGLHWQKPSLGLVEADGSRDNNIVFTEAFKCPSVCYEPDDTEAPYKLFYHGPSSKVPPGLYVAVSKDGLGWERLPGPIANTGERTNAVLGRIDGKYVVLSKAKEPDQYGGRCVVITMGGELRDFPEPQLIMKQDLLDGFNTEIYGIVAFPYADRYIGLLERYHGIPDLIDICLAWSDDLVSWERPPQREAFIGPEYPWNKRWSSPASSPPIRNGNQLWFYFGGQSGAHGHSKPNAAPGYSAIGLATITVDRFASLSSGFRAGKLVTKPMVWPGGDLAINASTSAALDGDPRLKDGEMRVEVQNAEGRSIAGFSGDESTLFKDNMPMRGFTDSAVLRWPGDRSMDELAGSSIRLVFHMRDCHLYSFRSTGPS